MKTTVNHHRSHSARIDVAIRQRQQIIVKSTRNKLSTNDFASRRGWESTYSGALTFKRKLQLSQELELNYTQRKYSFEHRARSGFIGRKFCWIVSCWTAEWGRARLYGRLERVVDEWVVAWLRRMVVKSSVAIRLDNHNSIHTIRKVVLQYAKKTAGVALNS